MPTTNNVGFALSANQYVSNPSDWELLRNGANFIGDLQHPVDDTVFAVLPYGERAGLARNHLAEHIGVLRTSGNKGASIPAASSAGNPLQKLLYAPSFGQGLKLGIDLL